MDKPIDIMNSTTDQVKELIEEVLKIEKDHQYIQNIEHNKSLEKDIAESIKKLIIKETSE